MIRKVAATVLLCAPLLGAPAQAVVVPVGAFKYVINHPTHGDIGTYTNTVRRQGDSVSVDTRVQVNVKVAFVTVHRLTADRSEAWQDGRLLSYKSVTEKNGDTITVDGRAEGDRFVIDSSTAGQVVAPPDVFPTNAWTIDITKADTVMATESGKVYPAKIASRTEQTVEIEGKPVRAHYFKVVGDTTYELWFDQEGVLVKFTTLTDGQPVAFTLDRPEA